MSAIRVGSYVTHSQRPAWGIGKVFGQSQQHVLVGFSALPVNDRFKRMEWRFGLLELAQLKQDAELDSWKVECDSTCHYIGAVEKPRKAVKAAPLTLEQAMERFVAKFNNGFEDSWYRSTHRDHRLSQCQTLTARLQPERLRALAVSDPRAAADMILQVLEAKSRPLLNGAELTRLREAFGDVSHLPSYLVAVADLLEAEQPAAKTFEAYLAALGRLSMPAQKTPLTWPLVTAIPYLAQPDRYLFVRPTATSRAATLLGFGLQLNRAPNWQTYERVLGMGNTLLTFIKPRGGQDMFDVQAFITAIGE